jgi:NAD(P)-dependent dehydrogenase (short-subunit alcohol dehydrogenase family)
VTLQDQRVLIFGGSSGIGLATARLAAAEGASVTVIGRSPEHLAEAARDLPTARMVEADITVETDIVRVLEGEPHIDHLVCTTGARAPGRVTTVDWASARGAFDAKFWGPMMVVRLGAPKLRGSVTLTAGAAAWTPSIGSVITSSVNGSVDALCRALAVDLAPVRVNAVSPGLIDTPTWDGMTEADRTAMYAKSAAAVPVGRVGRAQEVAEAFVFLMTNGFITGATLHIEGGQRLVRG